MKSLGFARIATGLALVAANALAVLPPPTEEEMAAENERIAELRDEAPEHLRLEITGVTSRDEGDTTWIVAEAEVLETYRSALGLEPGDLVELRYAGQWIAIERFSEELKKKAAEGYAGPGIESMPQQPVRVRIGDVVEAWLSESEAAPSATPRVPLVLAADVFSLQPVPAEPHASEKKDPQPQSSG
jgi:hypothetical protein